jgi:Protein of unknown function (DUF2934)
MDSEKERRVRERAYDIWQREGRPHGRDAEHWQQAAAEVEAESKLPAEPETVGAGGGPPPLRSRRAAKPGRNADPAPSAQPPKRPSR